MPICRIMLMENNILKTSDLQVQLDLLKELNFKAKSLIEKNLSFFGFFNLSIVSWKYRSYKEELLSFELFYNTLISELKRSNNKNLQNEIYTYFNTRLKEYPEIEISYFEDNRRSWLILIASLIFFPLILILVLKSFRKVNLLNHLLKDIILVNNKLIAAITNPEMAKLLSAKESLN